MSMDRILRDARGSHTTRTGHKKVMVGMNFVHCEDCGKYAWIYNSRIADLCMIVEGKAKFIMAEDF